MMTRSEEYGDAAIRLLAPAGPGPKHQLEERLRQHLDEARIRARIVLLSPASAESLVEASRDASLILLPLLMQRVRAVDPFGNAIEPLLEALPAVALISAAQDIDLDADPEGGDPGRAAELLDRAEELSADWKRARAAVQRTEEMLALASVEVERARPKRGPALEEAISAFAVAKQELSKAWALAESVDAELDTLRLQAKRQGLNIQVPKGAAGEPPVD
jgi:hypothetical protein